MGMRSLVRAMMVVFIGALAGLWLMGAQTAFAERGAGPCKDDIAKFCQGVQPGEGRITKCLQQNESQLSASCREHTACLDDIEKFCAGIAPGGGKIMKCLKQNENSLSSQCKAQLESHHQQQHQGQ